MFVRRCSDAAQQHQREQRDERMWMPHPIVSQARRNGGNFGRTRVESVCVRKHGIPPGPPAFDFPASNTMPAREGPEKRQSRSSAGFVFRRWRFFGSSERPPEVVRRSENRPSGPLEVALFRIKGKENYRWLRFERFSNERRSTSAASALARQLPALASLTCRIGPTW